MNKYPYIFVHGFNGWGNGEGIDRLVPYWGATTGDLMKFLEEKGYNGFSASVGPFSSAWDRTCELYAQLVGKTVDYGEVHSAKFNHFRYGRHYTEPVVEGWGELDEEGKKKKIDLIGHSFGATTVRLLVHLLTYGCPEEVNGTTEGNVSELFTGGKGDLVNAVVTICGVHNSATTYYFAEDFRIFNPLLFVTSLYAGAMGRSHLNGRLVDFHMEQFGLTNTPGKNDAASYLESVKKFMENRNDSCQYDLTPGGMKAINDMIETSPDVYYFSYPFKATKSDSKFNLTWPRLKSNPLIVPIAFYIGNLKDFTDETTGQVYDASWRDSDCLCNTVSQTYPFDEEHVEYDSNVSAKKGVWHVMPVQEGDHGQAIGLFANKEKTHKFYTEIAELLASLED